MLFPREKEAEADGMRHSSTISVIVSAYGVEAFLDQCIRSIVSQTYTDLEIILVDDGSPDRCGAICDEWAGKDSRIAVVHQRNRGISAARNTGLDRAGGEYLALIDGDDFLREDMLEILHGRMAADGSQMAVCNYIQTDLQGNHIGGPNGLHVTEDGIIGRQEGLAMFNDERYLFAAVVWNKLYRRELWDGIRFPEGKICEDGYVMHEVIGRCGRISVVKERLYRYTQREESIIHSGLTVRNLAHVEACCRRLKYFEKNGYRELCPDAARIAWEQYQWLRKEIPTRTWKEKLCLWQTGRMVRRSCRKYGPELPAKDPDRA